MSQQVLHPHDRVAHGAAGAGILSALIHSGMPLRKAFSVAGALIDTYRPGMTHEEYAAALAENPKAGPWLAIITALLPVILQLLAQLFPAPTPKEAA
jgi:hypothetical protein